jgi:hypothetical protein
MPTQRAQFVLFSKFSLVSERGLPFVILKTRYDRHVMGPPESRVCFKAFSSIRFKSHNSEEGNDPKQQSIPRSNK